MTGTSTRDLLTEYVTLLREFGVPREEIRELHSDGDRAGDAPLRAVVGDQFEAVTEEAVAVRLVEALSQSRRGIDATASYWNYAPEVHLNEVFEPYGCTVTFGDATHGDDGVVFEIEVRDSSNERHAMTFSYPDTPLDDDNFPALADAVERELLAGTDLTFVLLTPVDRRWRFVLLETGRLERLRARYGDRIEFAGFPVLDERQPPDFRDGGAIEDHPIARTVSSEDGDVPGTALRERARRGAGTFADVETSVSATSDPDAIADADPDDLIAAEAEPITGDRATPADERTPSAGVEASDEDLKQVFGDLSDVSIDAPEPTPGPDPEGPAAFELVEDVDDQLTEDVDDLATVAVDDDGEIDDLFRELEREAVTAPYDSRAADGGGTALLVEERDDGTADATAAEDRRSGVEADAIEWTGPDEFDGGTNGDAVEDILATVEQDPSAIIDVTAEELFDGLSGTNGEVPPEIADGSEATSPDEAEQSAFEWVSEDALASRSDHS